MSKAFKCDRCGKFSDKNIHLVSTEHKTYELCDECKAELFCFLKGGKLVDSDDKESIEETIDEPVDDYEIKKLIYNSYCSHDCETWYKCPYCGANIGSWSLYHQERYGESPHCTTCNKIVGIPKY